jgi:hypothetical protein
LKSFELVMGATAIPAIIKNIRNRIKRTVKKIKVLVALLLLRSTTIPIKRMEIIAIYIE